MHIDKYKQPDGWYTYPPEDPYDHETATDLLGSMVHFCGCGCPEEALSHLAKIMRLIHNHTINGFNKDTWDEINGFFHSEGEKYFTFYMLDHFEFAEHGGSVPGWLTPKGIEFMEDVEELTKQE